MRLARLEGIEERLEEAIEIEYLNDEDDGEYEENEDGESDEDE